MANKVTIDIEADFQDNVSGKTKAASSALKDLGKDAKAAAKEVDNLNKKKADPKLDADNSKLVKKVNDSTSKLKKVGNTKATAKIGALDKASQVISKVTGALKTLNSKAYKVAVDIRDSKALNALNKISSAGAKLAGKTWSAAVKVKDLATAPLRGIKNMLFSIQSIVMAIGAGIAANKLIADPISVADAYSSAKIGFSTLLGDSQGQAMMDQLDAFAKKTPFGTSNVISNAQKMMAMGWDAENIIKDMEVIGNAAAATGKLNQGLESIVRALSQIKTKGKLSTEELNQLAEAGISAKAMLAEQMGYGTGDEGIAAMTKDLENGKIASDAAIAALLAGMKKYDGMMDSMANETVEGLKSQLQDAYEISVKRKWGQGLQDGMKRALGSVVELLDESEDAMAAVGDTLYDMGQKASNWVADKFENAVQRVTDITGSFEFKNADLGEKLSMLWKGVVADPLKEWWDGGGQQKTADTAGKIGSWMGKAITSGLLTIFGVTDILDDETAKQLGESGGMSIAQGFAQGFKENFDGSAITEAFVDAIGDVWGALPTWAKFLIGGYAVGSVAGGISNLAGGIISGVGAAKTILGGFQASMPMIGPAYMAGSGMLGTIGKAGVALGATSTGSALLTGSAGIAGGVVGGVTAISGLIDAGKSAKAFKSGDETEGNANAASSAMKLGGVASGAAIGFALGGPLGALIGAGIGGVAGWAGGKKAANDIRAAAIESAELQKCLEAGEEATAEMFEKAKWESAKKRFGDIALSAEEITRLSQQLVWGDDLGTFDKFTSATNQAKASLEALNAAGKQTDRWMWKAGLGVKFNSDEVESIKASFDDYIQQAKNYVENKHYEFTASAEMLLDLESEQGKSILESGNAFYAQIQEQLSAVETELSNTLDKVLEDGVISSKEKIKVMIGGVEYEYNEAEAVAKLQAEAAKITKMVSEAEAEAEIMLIELKFGAGNMDSESFEAFMAATQENLNTRMSATDQAFEAQITNLHLRFPEGQRDSQEYKDELKTIADSYRLEVDSVRADILSVELNILGKAYEGDLGADAVKDLNNVLNHCISNKVDPVDLPMDEFVNLVGEPGMKEDVAAKLQEQLSGVYDQLELCKVDVPLMLSYGVTKFGEPTEAIESAVKETVPESVSETTTVEITAEKEVTPVELLAKEFHIPTSVAEDVIVKLNAAPAFQNQIDILCQDFGIQPWYAQNILWKMTGDKEIMNQISVTPDLFGIPDSIDKAVTINITGVANYKGVSVNGDGEGYRGGIFGGTSAMDAFARGGRTDNSGIVGGSTRFIRVNEESPEMIIPLSSQRRDRALKLWNKTGELLGVPGFFRGGRSNGDNDEGIRFGNYGGEDTSGGQSVEIDVGGVHVEINVDATNNANIVDSIKEQSGEIAEVIAGVLLEAFSGQYENTPLRGGIA